MQTAGQLVSTRTPSRWWLLGWAVVMAVGIFNLTRLIDSPLLADFHAYWDAALRVRNGAELFPPLTDPQAADVYRYAPWFAFAWVPMTFLPLGLAAAAWLSTLLLAAGWTLWRAFRRSPPLAVFMLPFMAIPVVIGNVQPLIIAGLLYALERRAGPIIIAAFASLKGVPVALTAVYVGRREWGRAVLAILGTALLTVPLLAFDLTNYPLTDGGFDHHYGVPWPWTGLAAIALSAVLARTRFAWLAGGVALLFLSPGVQAYHLTYVLLGIAAPATSSRPAS